MNGLHAIGSHASTRAFSIIINEICKCVNFFEPKVGGISRSRQSVGGIALKPSFFFKTRFLTGIKVASKYPLVTHAKRMTTMVIIQIT